MHARFARSRALLALYPTLLVSACGGGGGGDDGGSNTSDFLRNPAATVALGDVGASDLSELDITFLELALIGSGGATYLIEEGVDAPVTIDALAYQGTAAPIASRPIAAGSYDTLSFKLTITAKDLSQADVPVYPLFDPAGSLYTGVETTFPLGALNSFTVAEPADENQPYLFLHIDVANSVASGVVTDSITVGPRIFLSTRTPMALAGTITEIDATEGVFAVEDDKGTAYVVEPTDCTSFVAGFDQSSAGIGSQIAFANLDVGTSVVMDGVLGVDPGCDDLEQNAVRYHPHFLRTEFDTTGIAVVNGIVASVDTGGGPTLITLAVQSVIDAGTNTPIATNPGDTFSGDFTQCLVFTGLGEVRDLTGAAERLQPGEAIGVGVESFASAGAGQWSGTPRCGFLQTSSLGGMVGLVDDTQLVLLDAGVLKSDGSPYPPQAFLASLGGPATTVTISGDVTVAVGAGSEVFVGPQSGWQLTQVVDAYFDNQLTGPQGYDGQQLSGPCGDSAQIDLDIDVGALTAFVDHSSGGANTWTIRRLEIYVSSDATQKYVSWESGTPACTLPSNNAWNNAPCIASNSLHRERAQLGDSLEVNWANYAQSGAGAFGTSILNAGALVPGATVPPGSDTAGWDDLNERVLLGIDFDGDMYPFDDFADSCTGIEELAWVDISQAIFFYFSVDPLTSAVDMQYLSSYADFKSKVIDLQAAQQALSCGVGFHQNVGFGFSGVIDKNSIDTLVGGEVIPVIRAIDGRVFNGGCVTD
ncbi:MAG: hypothetical protein IT454_04805 [Planctomycetes bacterium]|nr:hypothetical protein [Planctomycetota bacterium]